MDGKNSFIERLLGSAEKFTPEQVEQTIQLLLEHGVVWQASDIHIEPQDQYVQVRYRVDGALKGGHKIPLGALPILMQHLKGQAHLDPANDHTPQNGQFTVVVDEHSYTVKVAIMPVLGGEKAVLHLAPQIREPHKLEHLGFWGSSLTSLQATLARSHGMIVVAAPKHHGRPTTTASMLAALNNPTLNIATVEEVVEYRIPHASQTAINPRAGLTMFTGLQAALHQDPNVLLVGNVPDKATAELAVQTALSGHLVVAGLHSDSAASALLHLRSMGIESYLLASTIRTVIAGVIAVLASFTTRAPQVRDFGCRAVRALIIAHAQFDGLFFKLVDTAEGAGRINAKDAFQQLQLLCGKLIAFATVFAQMTHQALGNNGTNSACQQI